MYARNRCVAQRAYSDEKNAPQIIVTGARRAHQINTVVGARRAVTMICAVVAAVATHIAAPQNIGLKRHIIAKRPAQPPDNIMVPAELWDDNRCRQIVGGVFDTIRHGPYKADLCRLYVLYRHGGVYTDDDIYLLRAPAMENLTVVRESPVYKESANNVGLFNAYIEVPWRYDTNILRAIAMSNKKIAVDIDRTTTTLWGPDILNRALKNVTKVTHQELCKPWPHNACSCTVPGILYSHKPCRY